MGSLRSSSAIWMKTRLQQFNLLGGKVAAAVIVVVLKFSTLLAQFKDDVRTAVLQLAARHSRVSAAGSSCCYLQALGRVQQGWVLTAEVMVSSLEDSWLYSSRQWSVAQCTGSKLVITILTSGCKNVYMQWH